MKKILSIVAVLLAIGLAVAGFLNDEPTTNEQAEQIRQRIESSISLYPVYERMNDAERDAYVALCAGFENFQTSDIKLISTDSQSDCNALKKSLQNIYREIVYEQSEYFWVNPYELKITTRTVGGKYQLLVEPTYILSKEETMEKRDAFQTRIDRIVSQANSKGTTYEKILFVHDYILENVVYDHALVEAGDYNKTGINAYGCLMGGKTICSGYTQAFTTIMRRLGIECGAEFSSYGMFSIFEGHVWNYCKLDGEYYYFDLTWDDIDPDSELAEYMDYYHCYFGLTKDEMTKARTYLDPDAPTPDCLGTKHNYFIHNNWNFATYNLEEVAPVIREQKESGCVQLRFDSYAELLRAQSDLLTDGKIWDLLDGIDNLKYVVSKSNLQLYILLVK